MQEAEYETLSRVEDDHWWFVGFRDLVKRYLNHPERQVPARASILDAGCGTGANLKFLNDLLAPKYLGGFDNSARAVELARAKCPTADVYLSDLCQPKLRTESLDLILCCDAIYVPGAAACKPGLQSLVDRLSPGGRLILHVPAYQWLYSQHDQAVHTRERYVRSQILDLLRSLGLECSLISYRLCPLLPAIVVARLPSIVWRKTRAEPKSDLGLPPQPINWMLTQLLKIENRLIVRGVRMPFGSSIMGIGFKR